MIKIQRHFQHPETWGVITPETTEEFLFLSTCFEILGDDDDGETVDSIIYVLNETRHKNISVSYTERILTLLQLGDVEYVDLRN